MAEPAEFLTQMPKQVINDGDSETGLMLNMFMPLFYNPIEKSQADRNFESNLVLKRL